MKYECPACGFPTDGSATHCRVCYSKLDGLKPTQEITIKHVSCPVCDQAAVKDSAQDDTIYCMNPDCGFMGILPNLFQPVVTAAKATPKCIWCHANKNSAAGMCNSCGRFPVQVPNANSYRNVCGPGYRIGDEGCRRNPNSERGTMIETQKYARKPFLVDAVQVTADNMEAVAEWCSGEVKATSNGNYIKVDVPRAMNDRQRKAFAGDWVLYANNGFKVYMAKAFTSGFEVTDAPAAQYFGPAPVTVKTPVVATRPTGPRPPKAVEVAPTAPQFTNTD